MFVSFCFSESGLPLSETKFLLLHRYLIPEKFRNSELNNKER